MVIDEAPSPQQEESRQASDMKLSIGASPDSCPMFDSRDEGYVVPTETQESPFQLASSPIDDLAENPTPRRSNSQQSESPAKSATGTILDENSDAEEKMKQYCDEPARKELEVNLQH